MTLLLLATAPLVGCLDPDAPIAASVGSTSTDTDGTTGTTDPMGTTQTPTGPSRVDTSGDADTVAATDPGTTDDSGTTSDIETMGSSGTTGPGDGGTTGSDTGNSSDSGTTGSDTGNSSDSGTTGSDTGNSSDSGTTVGSATATGTTSDEGSTSSGSTDTGGSSESGTTGEPPPEGYSDCAADLGACLPDEACLADDAISPSGTVCIDLSCDFPDDCPLAPPGGDAIVECDDITGDGDPDCFIDCSAGQLCPDGMICLEDVLCAWPAPPPGYGDCGSDPSACLPDESCVTDGPGTLAVCSEDACGSPVDCPFAAPGGTAPPSCGDITGDAIDECFLDCSAGDSCPTGMNCDSGLYCAWTIPPPDPPGFANCFADPTACLPSEDCITDDPLAPTTGACADLSCTDASECPAAPPGGTAPVDCAPLIGDGDGDCFIDCSGGAMCPPGMVCFSGLLCAWSAD